MSNLGSDSDDEKTYELLNDDNIKYLFDATQDFLKIVKDIDKRLNKLDGQDLSYHKIDLHGAKMKQNKIDGGRRTRGKLRSKSRTKSRAKSRKKRRRKRRRKNLKKRTKRRR
jgi:hypothetical protein